MFKVTNVSLDPDPKYEIKRRQASRLEMEPMVNGERLMLRSSVEISDEDFKRQEGELRRHWDSGVIEVTKGGGEKLQSKAPEVKAPEVPKGPSATEEPSAGAPPAGEAKDAETTIVPGTDSSKPQETQGKKRK